MRPARIGVAALLAVAALAACSTSDAPSAEPADVDVVGTWHHRSNPMRAEKPHMVRFDRDGTWSGSLDGCNAQAGTWAPAQSGSISLEVTESTEIACDGVSGEPDTATVEHGTLVIRAGDKKLRTLEQQPATPQAAGSRAPRSAVVGVWEHHASPGVEPSGPVEFKADGTWSGPLDGCNEQSGEWIFDAQRDGVAITILASTLMQCSQFPNASPNHAVVVNDQLIVSSGPLERVSLKRVKSSRPSA